MVLPLRLNTGVIQMHIDTRKWIQSISKTPQEAAEEYDRLSDAYDQDMLDRGYRAPEDAATILARCVSGKDVKILDAGCGTGMIGQALVEAGFSRITGVDISAKSLEQASSKTVYQDLHQVNLLESLPFEAGSFDAIVCVGVCSRFSDIQILELIQRMDQVLLDPGVIILSHREDLMQASELQQLLKTRLPIGLRLEEVTTPHPYIPLDENYEKIGVQYLILRRKSSIH